MRATPIGANRNLVTVVEAKTQGERLRRIWPEAETDADARELDRLFEIAIEQGYEVGQRARNRALYLKQLSDDAMAKLGTPEGTALRERSEAEMYGHLRHRGA